MRRAGRQAIYSALCGIGIGWMTGLSVTPGTGQTVISALLGLGIGLATGFKLSGGEGGEGQPGRVRIGLLPVALLVLGLSGGATLGIVGRTHNWLGTESTDPKKRGGEEGAAADADPASRTPGLFAGRGTVCEELAYSAQHDTDEVFRDELRRDLPLSERMASTPGELKNLRQIIVFACENAPRNTKK